MAKKCSRILKMEIKWFWKAAGFLLLFLMPVFSFIAFETIIGNLQWIWEERMTWNILWIAVFYMIAFAVSGTSRIAVPVISLLFFVLAAAEAMVEEFRGTSMMVWDLLVIIFPARLRWWREWLIGRIGFAGMAIGLVCCFYMKIVPGQRLEINM